MHDKACVEMQMAVEVKIKAIEDRKAAKDIEKRRWEALSADEKKAERAAKWRRNKELRDREAQIIEECDRQNINPNLAVIEDFNSSDIEIDIFEEDSIFSWFL